MVPEGVPITRSWLLDKELSRHTIDNLLKAKQLELLAKGIYIRNRSRMTWQSVVYSLQYIQKKNALIGGWKALELQGFHHYLNLTNKDEIQIFTDLKIPNWVHQMIQDVQFIVHHHHALAKDDNKTGEQKSVKLSREDFIRKHKWREVLEELKISSPERAFMEVLLDVPHRISFEHADQLMKGMTSLSPVSVQLLLELCTS